PVCEIRRQLQAWRALTVSQGALRIVDSGAGERPLLAQALDAIDDVLGQRLGQYELTELAFKCLGGLSTLGACYRVCSVRGQPRWLLPPGVDTLSSGLYRPANRRHHAAALLLDRVGKGLEVGVDLR